MSRKQPITPLYIISAILILVLTWAVFTVYQRYQATSKELIINQHFSDGLVGWQAKGRKSMQSLEGNTFTMRIEQPHRTQLLIQSFFELPAGTYQVRADIQLTDVIQGKDNWHNAGIIVATYNADGGRSQSYDITTTSGTIPWQSIEQVIELGSASPRLDIVVRMLKSPGALKVRNISFTRVAQAPYHDLLRLVFTVLWALFGIATLLTLEKLNPTFWAKTILLVVGVIALLGILAPKHIITNINNQVAALLPSSISTGLNHLFRNLLQLPLLDQPAQFSKFGHFLIFTLLAIIIKVGFRSAHWLRTLFVLVYIILASETVQMLTNARSATTTDLLIDGAGVLVGLLVAGLILFSHTPRQD